MNHPFFREASLEVRCLLTCSAWDLDDDLTEDDLIEFCESVSRFAHCSPDIGDTVLVHMDIPAEHFSSFYASVGLGAFGRDVHLEILSLVLRPIIDENETSDGIVYYPRGRVTLLETVQPDVTFQPGLEVPKSFRHATTFVNVPTTVDLANSRLSAIKATRSVEEGDA